MAPPRRKKAKLEGNEHHLLEDKPSLFMTMLPLELRDAVYGLVLTQDKPISLVIHVRQKKNGGSFLARDDLDIVKKGNGKPAANRAALLRVSKEIFDNSTRVFYAENAFVFRTTTALSSFLDIVGERAQHLREVRIGPSGYMHSTARKAFRMLATAKKLKSLTIDHSDICNIWGLGGLQTNHKPKLTHERLASDCKALLKSLKQSHINLNLSGSVSDVIKIHLELPAVLSCPSCNVGSGHGQFCRTHNLWVEEKTDSCFSCLKCRCDEFQAVKDKFVSQVRSVAAGYLGIKEGEDSGD